MNKIIAISLFSLISISSLHAQDSLSVAQSDELTDKSKSLRSFKPMPGDLGVMVNVEGLISNISMNPGRDLLNNASFFLRYTQSENITFRIGFAPQINRTNVMSTDSIGKDLVEFDSTYSQANFSVRPGVEFHLNGTKRLDPYFAIDAELGLIGKTNIGSVSQTTDTTGTSRMVRTITEAGGYALGAKLSFGMNYFVAPKLFLGMEYGLGITNYVTGGDRQEVVQIEPVSGANTTIRDLSSTRSNNFNFYVDPMVRLTVGYFFGL
ncbi:MAG: hypothetical protein WEC59_11695 [Salibacteraceae bacterium]